MMFRPRWPSAGPMGGDGFALPAGTWSLIRPTIFFATAHSPLGSSGHRLHGVLPGKKKNSGLLDLPEIQLHRRRASEDQDGNADLALLVIHFLDRSVEVRERPFGDANRL